MQEKLEKNEEEVLISIIVPVYNVADYIEKCIDSLINQTYHHLEIILIDDGSTDKSGEICDNYAQMDKRITVYHKANGGLSDARNYGIDRAHGRFLGFVDGDDWVHSQMYEIMCDKLESENADVITCWFEQRNQENFRKVIKNEEVSVINVNGAEALIHIDKTLVVAWNKLYKKEIFYNLRYPVGRLHEDEFVIHRVFRQCKKVTIINKPLYYYTIRNNSIVAVMTEKRIQDALDALQSRIEFADKEKWWEVMPAVIKGYCEYCIDRYYDIKNGKCDIDVEMADILWKAEHDVCNKYKINNIDKRYYKFAQSPKVYERYLKIMSIRTEINSLWLIVYDKLRRRKNDV